MIKKQKKNHMEKVKIKRVKRNKKQITIKAKILAGLGAGSALTGLGMGGQISNVKPQQKMVSTKKNESDSISGKIKKAVANTFGIKVVKAMADPYADVTEITRAIAESLVAKNIYERGLNRGFYGNFDYSTAVDTANRAFSTNIAPLGHAQTNQTGSGEVKTEGKNLLGGTTEGDNQGSGEGAPATTGGNWIDTTVFENIMNQQQTGLAPGQQGPVLPPDTNITLPWFVTNPVDSASEMLNTPPPDASSSKYDPLTNTTGGQYGTYEGQQQNGYQNPDITQGTEGMFGPGTGLDALGNQVLPPVSNGNSNDVWNNVTGEQAPAVNYPGINVADFENIMTQQQTGLAPGEQGPVLPPDTNITLPWYVSNPNDDMGRMLNTPPPDLSSVYSLALDVQGKPILDANKEPLYKDQNGNLIDSNGNIVNTNNLTLNVITKNTVVPGNSSVTINGEIFTKDSDGRILRGDGSVLKIPSLVNISNDVTPELYARIDAALNQGTTTSTLIKQLNYNGQTYTVDTNGNVFDSQNNRVVLPQSIINQINNTAAGHVIAPGETLSQIAYRTGTTVENILAVNPSITDANKIFEGQYIVIPGKNFDPASVQPKPQDIPSGYESVNTNMGWLPKNMVEAMGATVINNSTQTPIEYIPAVGVRTDSQVPTAPMPGVIQRQIDEMNRTVFNTPGQNSVGNISSYITTLGQQGVMTFVNTDGTYTLLNVSTGQTEQKTLEQMATDSSVGSSVGQRGIQTGAPVGVTVDNPLSDGPVEGLSSDALKNANQQISENFTNQLINNYTSQTPVAAPEVTVPVTAQAPFVVGDISVPKTTVQTNEIKFDDLASSASQEFMKKLNSAGTDYAITKDANGNSIFFVQPDGVKKGDRNNYIQVTSSQVQGYFEQFGGSFDGFVLPKPAKDGTELYNFGTTSKPVWVDHDGVIYDKNGVATNKTVDTNGSSVLSKIMNLQNSAEKAISKGIADAKSKLPFINKTDGDKIAADGVTVLYNYGDEKNPIYSDWFGNVYDSKGSPLGWSLDQVVKDASLVKIKAPGAPDRFASDGVTGLVDVSLKDGSKASVDSNGIIYSKDGNSTGIPFQTFLSAGLSSNSIPEKISADGKTFIYNYGTDAKPKWADVNGNIFNNSGVFTGKQIKIEDLNQTESEKISKIGGFLITGLSVVNPAAGAVINRTGLTKTNQEKFQGWASGPVGSDPTFSFTFKDGSAIIASKTDVQNFFNNSRNPSDYNLKTFIESYGSNDSKKP